MILQFRYRIVSLIDVMLSDLFVACFLFCCVFLFCKLVDDSLTKFQSGACLSCFHISCYYQQMTVFPELKGK